jgi:LacI family repressor for deo operon, udp, cdd, tsx, nupC, and nupG
MAVRLKDIAETVGVSIATVSRVLNGREASGFLSEEMRQRIFAVAAELGYRPNLMARALRGSRSSLIGVIIRDIADPFMSETLKGIHSAAVKRGYRLFLGHVEQPYTAMDYGTMFEQSHADGILLLGDMNEDQDAVEFLTSKHSHIVGVVDLAMHRKIPSVYTDNALGAKLALDHLWSLGHREIVCVAEQGAQDRVLRVQGYRDWMQEHGLAARVVACEASPQAAFEVGRQIFTEERIPTAMFAITDRIAMGLLGAAFNARIAVPTQVSIIGFDNIEFAAHFVPPLTTVNQAPTQMGFTATELLLDMIEQDMDISAVQDIVMVPELIIRETTGLANGDR